MPAAWLAIAGAAANVGGSFLSSQGAKKSAQAQEDAANQIIADTQAFQDQSFGLIGDSRGVGNEFLEGIEGIEPFDPLPFRRSKQPTHRQFVQGGRRFANLSFRDQTAQKRQNLQFALGDSLDLLRDSQLDFSRLASGDTSDFSRELNASAFGALANTAGAPVGSFGNISAKNLFNFRTEGLRNSMAIGDFFAEQGTVDPVDPLPSIFALAEFRQREDTQREAIEQFNRRLDFEVARHNSGLSLDTAGLGINFESALLNAGLGTLSTGLDYTSNARLIEAQAAGAGQAASGQALNSLGAGLGQIGGVFGDLSAANQSSADIAAYSSFLGSNSSNPTFQSFAS